jgi:hypothetical protein
VSAARLARALVLPLTAAVCAIAGLLLLTSGGPL